jgi:predicted signal transduction protein with EAL and GGDEF domain
MRMAWGSLVAYYLAGVINPAFIAIAVMIALFIPVLIVDLYLPSRPED